MQRINEGSESYVTAIPLDIDGEEFTPDAMRYRVGCLTSGVVVLDWTSISIPSTENLITVTSAQNAIVNQCNRREKKQMIVETTSGTAVHRDFINWEVLNLFGVR